MARSFLLPAALFDSSSPIAGKLGGKTAAGTVEHLPRDDDGDDAVTKLGWDFSKRSLEREIYKLGANVARVLFASSMNNVERLRVPSPLEKEGIEPPCVSG